MKLIPICQHCRYDIILVIVPAKINEIFTP